MSKYVNKMREALIAFNAVAAEFHEQIAEARERLAGEYAVAEIGNLRGQLNQATTAANNQIDGIHEEAKAAAQKWAALDGKEVNAEDMALLKGGFDLSEQDMTALVAKYWDNGTMINAIDKHIKTERDQRRYYAPEVYVPRLNDKLQAYATLAKGAHNMIGGISEGRCYTADVLEAWGAVGNVSEQVERALYGVH